MDYGPSLTHSYEVPGDFHNIAYKGIAMRLDPGAGGVARGRYWMMFDTDTLRMAAAWSASDPPSADQNFIDWRGIQFNGEHQIHPSVTGSVIASNGTGPAGRINFERIHGRSTSARSRQSAVRSVTSCVGKFNGTYYHGQQVILSYSVGSADLLRCRRCR